MFVVPGTSSFVIVISDFILHSTLILTAFTWSLCQVKMTLITIQRHVHVHTVPLESYLLQLIF